MVRKEIKPLKLERLKRMCIMLVDQMNLIREIAGTGIASFIVVGGLFLFNRLVSAR